MAVLPRNERVTAARERDRISILLNIYEARRNALYNTRIAGCKVNRSYI